MKSVGISFEAEKCIWHQSAWLMGQINKLLEDMRMKKTIKEITTAEMIQCWVSLSEPFSWCPIWGIYTLHCSSLAMVHNPVVAVTFNKRVKHIPNGTKHQGRVYTAKIQNLYVYLCMSKCIMGNQFTSSNTSHPPFFSCSTLVT